MKKKFILGGLIILMVLADMAATICMCIYQGGSFDGCLMAAALARSFATVGIAVTSGNIVKME